jgi:hypothetical protein
MLFQTRTRETVDCVASNHNIGYEATWAKTPSGGKKDLGQNNLQRQKFLPRQKLWKQEVLGIYYPNFQTNPVVWCWMTLNLRLIRYSVSLPEGNWV